MKNKKKVTQKQKKVSRKYEVDEILELMGIINRGVNNGKFENSSKNDAHFQKEKKKI